MPEAALKIFLDFIAVTGIPPKAVLLQTGIQTNNFIEALFMKHTSAIKDLEAFEDYGLLELY